MKIVFNTKHPDAAASLFYKHAFSEVKEISFFDWDSYADYDIVLFMSFLDDLNEISDAKKQNPNLKIGLIDPRTSDIREHISQIDFIIIDSIEMKDFFAQFQRPMFTYYEYPDIKKTPKTHTDKDVTTIAYHGNKVHLAGMSPKITRAIELLGEKYKIKFRAMYNIEALGKWEYGVPKNVQVEHVQWKEENYYSYMAEADIGIVPNLMPVRNIEKIKKKFSIYKKVLLESKDDYLIRFKVPSNPGRIIVFSRLGIPVVADMFPSALQFIRDGYNGFVACNCGGWYNALEQLIIDHNLRNTFAKNMTDCIAPVTDFKIQNDKLKGFLKDILTNPENRKKSPINQPEETKSSSLSLLREACSIVPSRIASRLNRAFLK